MTRPETVANLTPDQRRGPEFASFDLGAFPIDGRLTKLLGKFIAHGGSLFSVEMVREQTRLAFYATPSAEQLESVLAQQQSGWDYMSRKYEKALDGAIPNDNEVWLINQWCAREGLDLPWAAVTE